MSYDCYLYSLKNHLINIKFLILLQSQQKCIQLGLYNRSDQPHGLSHLLSPGPDNLYGMSHLNTEKLQDMALMA
jgi:hypothetical protein